jgi:alpha-tubulin suppressor-like RCC1 family protein
VALRAAVVTVLHRRRFSKAAKKQAGSLSYRLGMRRGFFLQLPLIETTLVTRNRPFPAMNLLRLVATVVLALTLPAGAAEVAATFASAATVPVTAAGYSATGNTVHPALNFTPPTGTSLTVVSNTGVGFIDGAFSNLAQGQTVTLGFGGVDYQFVANYYGGSGNDLVLQWANTRLVAWGANSNGSLGTGNSAGSSIPVRVDMAGVLAGKVVTRLAAATSRSLVLCADGTLVNWGSNHSGTGSLGNGSWPDSPMPVLVDQTGVLAGKTVVAIAAGGYHSLALGVDGTLAAWGSDSWGQLGHGGTSSNVPVLVDRTGVLAGKSIVAVAAGENHSLALCADGDIAAWGSNATGQLGNNSTVNSGVPVLVDRAGVLAGKTVVAVAAGNYHSLALCSDGSLVAWGASGTLGNNATANSLVPVLVDGSGILAAKSPVAASAGGGHNLALCSDGTLAAWGYNANGQLGNNGTATGLVPVAVVQTGVLAGRTVVGIAAGGAHSLALGADGTIAAWGKGYSGELGNNSLAQSTVPVWVDTRDLGTGERFVAASAGADHSLALVASPPPPVATTLAATGIVDTGATLHGNVNTQGTVTTVTFHYGTTTSYGWTMNAVPVTVSGAATTAATAVLAGLSAGTTYHYRIAAASAGGTVWGEDLTFTTTNQAYLNQLTLAGGTLLPEFASSITGYAAAVPFTTGSITVTPVVGLPTSTVRVNGTLVASGDASGPINLAVGNNVITIAVTAADGSNTKTYRVTVTRLPEIYAFGSGTTVPVVVSDFKATGNAATFALNFVPPAGTNLTVVNNTGREPIRGTFSNLAQGQPVQLTYGGINYAFVANYFGGTGNDLVLQWANNRLLAWGDNFFGALGNGGTTNSYVPTPVTLGGALAGKTIIALAAGFSNSAALCSDGTVAEWGNGVTGTPRLASRTGVLAGKMAVAISAGNTHRLALCADGTVVAWGENSNGQLGDGTTYTSRDPVLVNRTGVLASKTVIAIAAGTRHSLALGSDGTLAAWGSNNGGQLGNNSTTNSPVPVLVDQSGVLFGKTVVAIAAGLEVCYALCSDGSVASWGSGAFGQLGNHRTLSSSVPVLVDRSGVLANRTIAAISAGASHAAVFCTNRSVAAWGVNASGELGSAPTDTSTPSLVYTGGYLSQKTVTGITAGGSHNLAFCTDGGLVAWGRNNQGQLGNGLTTEGGPVLIRMEALKTGERFVAAACGSYHSLGLVASLPLALAATLPPTDITRTRGTFNGGVTAQGTTTTVSFEYGLTTAYGTIVAATPGSVTGTTATAASALVTGLQPGTIYHYRIIATNSGGTAKGEDMTLTTPDFACLASLSMTDATLVPGFSMIQSGYIAIVPFATSRVSLTPVAVYGSSSITVNGIPVASGVASEPIELAVGNNVIQTVVTDVDGTRTYGITVTRLPEIFRFDSAATVPVTVSDFEAGGHSATFALNFAPGAGTNFTVVNNTGPRFIRGTFTNLAHGQVVTLPFGGVAYRFVANYYGGSGNDLVLHWAANRLFAWGSNFSGQLGDGTTSNDLPKPLGDLGSLASKMILAGAVGYGFNLVLAADGTLAAWGENGDGQLGNGGTVDSKVPVAVNQTGVLAGKTVVAVAASYDRCLVLCSDGTLATWGKGATSKMPELVSQTGALAGKSVVAIAAGYDHCLALCDDGTVAAWGGNDSGQLGNGSREWPGLPVAVDTLGVLADKQVTAIAAGNYFSLALCNDGTVAAWGSNTWGRLGADWGPYPTNLPVAVSRAGVLAGKTVVALAAGNSHALALCADGAMVAWGFNSSGQLGNGNTTDSPVPVSVNQT